MSELNQTCATCHTSFSFTQRELDLYAKWGFHPRKTCFYCDQKHKLSFRNERTLYKRKCDGTAQDILSIYPQNSPYKVYQSEYWYSDKYDPLFYGRNFDFNKTFFEQFLEVKMAVPRLALMNVHSENSEYCNMAFSNKNCYLVFGGDFNQDCMYGTLCMHNTSTFDNDYGNHNELCYMVGDSINSYGSQFIFDSQNCNHCYFISDCIGCSDCILCTNLIKKSFCIGNKQYSKEEYEQKKKLLINGSFLQQQNNFEQFKQILGNRAVKFSHMINCVDSSGDYLKNCKNVQNCFDVSDSQDMCNIIFAAKAKDCFDCSLIGDNDELSYCCASSMGNTDVKFSFFTIESSNIECCDTTMNSHYLFGCSGLRQKSYCILNKQYKKEEYESLRQAVILHMQKTGEWGKFFPKNLSPFGYNETSANNYFPLTKDQAFSQGFKWQDEVSATYRPQSYQIPDNIDQLSRNICNEILACPGCHKNFKIQEKELNFYARLKIPAPRQCPQCRHITRQNLRNPRKLYQRNCVNCRVSIQSSYAPDRPEMVHCEKCYLQLLTSRERI